MGELSIIDPAYDSDFDGRLAGLPGVTVFHTAAWFKVLAETYGHCPYYLAKSASGRLTGILPLVEVKSVVSGCRGVALPFTDFCGEAGIAGEVADLRARALELGRKRHWRYIEFRSRAVPGAASELHAPPCASSASVQFRTHEVPTGGSSQELLGAFSPAVCRALRKAQKSGVEARISDGDEASMFDYYRLHCLTRKRHGLPPQPWQFFDSIRRNVVNKGHGFVVLGSVNRRPVSGAVFFHFAGAGVYKFGASDISAQPLRANNLVMWQGLKRCGELGCQSVHLGRTSMGNAGLRQFKLGFGSVERTVEYERYDFRSETYVQTPDRAEPSWVNHVFRALPISCLRMAGSLLYPHLS